MLLLDNKQKMAWLKIVPGIWMTHYSSKEEMQMDDRHVENMTNINNNYVNAN